MAEHRVFQGFFSYAHHDAETDPDLFEALTDELEKRVMAKLVNDYFVIWRDSKRLHTGYLWDPAIEDAVRASNVMIVLLTPRWISSDYCRKEYAIFQQIEAAAGNAQLVAPIRARLVENQKQKFDEDQKRVFESLSRRQYFQMPAANFLRLPANLTAS
jgi:hypothetical protein